MKGRRALALLSSTPTGLVVDRRCAAAKVPLLGNGLGGQMRGVILLAALLIGGSHSASAQVPVTSVGNSEIIVTGARRNIDNYDSQSPAVGLRRVADFAVQPVKVTGDTRDLDLRHKEIYDTIGSAIGLANSYGVELAFGEVVVEPLTLANYRGLTLSKDDRPDTNKVELLVKAKLNGTDAREATGRIDRFLKALKPVGRTLVDPIDDMTLSVVAPDQYRGEIGKLIALDASAMAAKFGPDYAVEVRGLNRPVEWSRASLTEVFLYVPYELVIRPKS